MVETLAKWRRHSRRALPLSAKAARCVVLQIARGGEEDASLSARSSAQPIFEKARASRIPLMPPSGLVLCRRTEEKSMPLAARMCLRAPSDNICLASRRARGNTPPQRKALWLCLEVRNIRHELELAAQCRLGVCTRLERCAVLRRGDLRQQLFP